MIGIPLPDRGGDVLAHGRVAHKLRRRFVAADELAAAGRVEPGQHADRVAILAGDDRVLQRRRGCSEHADAKRSDRDPSSGSQLEIFR